MFFQKCVSAISIFLDDLFFCVYNNVSIDLLTCTGEWLLQKDLQVEKNFLGVVIGFGATNQQNNALSSFLKQGRIRLLNNET